jgi:hypothetical protein
VNVVDGGQEDPVPVDWLVVSVHEDVLSSVEDSFVLAELVLQSPHSVEVEVPELVGVVVDSGPVLVGSVVGLLDWLDWECLLSTDVEVLLVPPPPVLDVLPVVPCEPWVVLDVDPE